MSTFDRYNFKLSRAIMASLKPVKELPPPFFVRVETEVYKERRFFVQVEWRERFQDTHTMHVYDRNVFMLGWDTTDYTNWDLPEQEPSLFYHYVLNLDEPAKRTAFQVAAAMKFNFKQEFIAQFANFQAVIWHLLNMPLWKRLQYVEKVVKSKKVREPEKLKRLSDASRL